MSDKKLENIKNGLIKDAITNARGKASITASALGLRIVGSVKSVDLTEGFQPVLPREALTTTASAVSATSNRPTPIIPDEQQVSQTVVDMVLYHLQ